MSPHFLSLDIVVATAILGPLIHRQSVAVGKPGIGLLPHFSNSVGSSSPATQRLLASAELRHSASSYDFQQGRCVWKFARCAFAPSGVRSPPEVRLLPGFVHGAATLLLLGLWPLCNRRLHRYSGLRRHARSSDVALFSPIFRTEQ